MFYVKEPWVFEEIEDRDTVGYIIGACKWNNLDYEVSSYKKHYDNRIMQYTKVLTDVTVYCTTEQYNAIVREM